MNFSDAKQEFLVRYYLWATSVFEEEINESLPKMGWFKAGSIWKSRQFMQQLEKGEQRTLAHSLLKRFHPQAVQTLNESVSTEEELLLSRFVAFRRIPAGPDAEIAARQLAGEKIKFASRKKLRKRMTAQFKSVFGSECFGLEGIDEEPDPAFKMKCNGWVLNTFFHFGRNDVRVEYSHNIESETTFEYHGARVATMGLHSGISFGTWLGITNQTQWPYVMDEDIESNCDAAIKLCGHFFAVAPRLLKGLECEKITPPER